MEASESKQEATEIIKLMDQADTIYKWSYFGVGAVIFALFMHQGWWIRGLIAWSSFVIFADSLGRLISVYIQGLTKLIEVTAEAVIKSR